ANATWPEDLITVGKGRPGGLRYGRLGFFQRTVSEGAFISRTFLGGPASSLLRRRVPFAPRPRRPGVGHQLIHRPVPGPRAASKERLLDLLVREVGVGVTLHPDERPGRLAAGHGMFPRPDLRHDLILVVARAPRRRNLHDRQHVDRGLLRPRDRKEG